MNPNYMEHKFPQIKPHPFNRVPHLSPHPFRPVSDRIGFPIEVLFELGKFFQVECWFFQTGTHVCHPIATSSVAVVSTVSAPATAAAVSV